MKEKENLNLKATELRFYHAQQVATGTSSYLYE